MGVYGRNRHCIVGAKMGLRNYSLTREDLNGHIAMRITPADSACSREIEIWCHQTWFGKRVNRRTFAFKNESDLTMFIMRWG